MAISESIITDVVIYAGFFTIATIGLDRLFDYLMYTRHNGNNRGK